MSRLKTFLKNNPRVQRLIEWLQTVSFPGFEGVPVYDVVVFFYHEILRDAISIRAASIAFNFFLAIFPAILFLFTLIPYIPIEGLQENILALLKDLLPHDVYNLILETVIDIISRPRGGLLSLGFFLALYFATNGMVAIMNSFDKTYSAFTTRSYLMVRLIALELTLVISTLLLITIILIMGGSYILEFLLEYFNLRSTFYLLLLNAIKWIAIIFLLFFSYSFIYYYGPAVKKRFKFISVGSTVATFLTIIISLGFSYYVNNFAAYNKLYGSIGTIIALLLWLYFNAYALLIGFELNASIAVNKRLIMENEHLIEEP